jgi:hypothetical protein
MNCYITKAHFGEISEGRTTAQFPAAMASTNGLIVRLKGKFHEPMMHTMPRGSN